MTCPHADLIAVHRRLCAHQYFAGGDMLSGAKLWDDIREMKDRVGACSNFATGMLRDLVEAGRPIETLRLACCYVAPGRNPEDYHAVLTVECDDGLWVLDIRQPEPVTTAELEHLGYELDCIQAQGGQIFDWKPWRQ